MAVSKYVGSKTPKGDAYNVAFNGGIRPRFNEHERFSVGGREENGWLGRRPGKTHENGWVGGSDTLSRIRNDFEIVFSSADLRRWKNDDLHGFSVCPGHGCTNLSGCWRLKPCGCGGGDNEDEDEEDEAEKAKDMLYPVPANSVSGYTFFIFSKELYPDPPHVFAFFGWPGRHTLIPCSVAAKVGYQNYLNLGAWVMRIDTCSGGREEGQQGDVCHGEEDEGLCGGGVVNGDGGGEEDDDNSVEVLGQPLPIFSVVGLAGNGFHEPAGNGQSIPSSVS
ncbi:hypothetical protein V8G54_026720 [Vigna mungo]|uniref:Uncharacterized protein n=1 Tax=Vigna mungo TaxID=3915 RepID=A0AAQ3N1J8_VIGMU